MPSRTLYSHPSPVFPLPGVHDLVKTRVHAGFRSRPARGNAYRGRLFRFSRRRPAAVAAAAAAGRRRRRPVVTAKVAERTCRSTSPPSATSRRTPRSRPLAGHRRSCRRSSFHEGDFVKKGDALFTIDPRPFEAALAAGRRPTSCATRRCSTRPKRSSTRDARQRRVLSSSPPSARRSSTQRGIISKDVAEQARAAADATAALVKADKAAIESAQAQLVAQQAAVDTAKVQLELHDHPSPIDGRTGNLTVKAGNLVTANTTELIDDRAGRSRSTSRSRCRRCTCRPSRRTWREGKLPVTATPQDADAQAGDRRADLRRQRRRHDDRHDQAEGDVRRTPTAGCGPASSRASAAADDAAARDGRAGAGGADRPGRPVRVRREARLHRRAAAGHRRPARRATTSSSRRGCKPGETVVTEGQLRLEPGTRVHDGSDAAAAARARRRGGRGGRRPGRRRQRRQRRVSAAAAGSQRAGAHVNISEIFIRRPIATSLLMAAIALFGVVAYRALPVSDLPTVDFPTLNVSAGLPGGDPGTMASAVASPLERQFTTIAGLDAMTSSSAHRQHATSRCSSISTATSTARPSTCRRRSRRRCRCCRPGMPAPPSFRKVEPGRPADPACSA